MAQQYLPSGLQGQVFYQPSDQGYENQIRLQVARRREAQLAAMVDGGAAAPEALTHSPQDAATERWLQRTLSQAGDQLAHIRDRIFELATPQRHHRVLDLNAKTGLLTWEAVRRVPEGGVFARVQTRQEQAALEEQAAQLPELTRPLVVPAPLLQLPQRLRAQLAVNGAGGICDRIIGRNALGGEPDKVAVLQSLMALLTEDGIMVLAEVVPRHSQLISALVPDRLPAALYRRWQAADAAITHTDDPRFNWDAQSLEALCSAQGWPTHLNVETVHSRLYLSEKLIQRWFSATPTSYASQLQPYLKEQDLQAIQKACQQLQNQTVEWRSQLLWLVSYSSKSMASGTKGLEKK